MEEVENIGLLKFDIKFDQTKLEFVSINKSTTLSNLISLNKTKSDGTEEVYLGMEDGTNTGISGTYTIYTLQFKAIQTGNSQIEFVNSEMRSPGNDPITANQAEICVVEIN